MDVQQNAPAAEAATPAAGSIPATPAGTPPPGTPTPGSPAEHTSDGSWRDSLPDTIRDNPSLMETKSVNDLAQRFLDTKQMVGNSLRMPTADAGQEAVDAFTAKILANESLGLMNKPNMTDPDAMGAVYDSLGRPADAEGYAVVEGADMTHYKAMTDLAHKLGLSKAQFEGLAAGQIELQGGQLAEMQATQNAEHKTLQQEWGPAFEQKVGKATTMLELTGAPKELIEAMASGDVGADVMRWVDKIATSLGTEGAPMANDLTAVTADTTMELRQRRDEITQRIMTENLSQTQQQELQQRMVKLSERIMKAEGRE